MGYAQLYAPFHVPFACSAPLRTQQVFSAPNYVDQAGNKGAFVSTVVTLIIVFFNLKIIIIPCFTIRSASILQAHMSIFSLMPHHILRWNLWRMFREDSGVWWCELSVLSHRFRQMLICWEIFCIMTGHDQHDILPRGPRKFLLPGVGKFFWLYTQWLQDKAIKHVVLPF